MLLCLFPIIYFFNAIGMQSAASLLEHKADPYGGVVIQINENIDGFKQKLADSLAQWKQQKKRGIWLTVPVEHAKYVSAAVKQGFVPHHSTEKKFVLTRWLPENEPNMLPSYATRTAGISAIVIDDKNRILLVKEKYHPEWGYKMPSGAVKMGESIQDAAVRETKEETGIDVEFVSVVGWCERHNTPMDKVSDHFFACLLRPKNFNVVAEEAEVSEVLWMPLAEYKKIATGPQLPFLKALEASGSAYVAYTVSSFSGKGTVTYFARPGADIQ